MSFPAASPVASPDDPFTARYAEAAPALHAWARLSVRGALAGRLDPEDLVQEVCVAAFGSRAVYDPARGSFRGWLFGVARNVLLVQLRATARARARGDAADPLHSRAAEVPEEATTVSRRVARDERLARAVERLEQLEEDDRRLVVLRGLEGLSHAEVAEVTGLGEEQAGKRWRRLRARLAELPQLAALLED